MSLLFERVPLSSLFWRTFHRDRTEKHCRRQLSSPEVWAEHLLWNLKKAH